MLNIALIGNPNSGKTTLFNTITGSSYHVGNWPGKTVEKKSAIIKFNKNQARLTDLPGVYSLSPYSEEETISRNFLNNKPDLVINIIDATNFERNLFLTLELLEMGLNVHIVVNLGNIAKKKGMFVNSKKLSELLLTDVTCIDARNKREVFDFFNKISFKKPTSPRFNIKYDDSLEQILSELSNITHNRFESIRAIEHNLPLKDISIPEIRKKLTKKYDPDLIFSEKRQSVAGNIAKNTLDRKFVKKSTSDLIDKFTLNKYLGIPIFLFIMFLMFQLTFTLAKPIIRLIEISISYISTLTTSLLTTSPIWFQSLIDDGILSGIGSVIIFLPNIFILFLVISILEDSGYLARAAFIMDKHMHKIGLHGKSFIPLILGFGCNVPAVMATRTLSNQKEKLLTILINPFISCSARLPIYILFVGAFFTAYQGLIIFSLYLLGVIVAIISGLIFRKFLIKTPTEDMIMELPAYRIPGTLTALRNSWDRSKQFIKQAGTYIFSFILLIWFLSSFPFGVEYASQQSLMGIIGNIIAPIFKPLGFNHWQIGVALIFGIAAKEVVISTFGTLYGVAQGGLTPIIQSLFTPLTAYTFMIVTLLYIPCIATLSVMRKETGSIKWPLFSVTYSFTIAWVLAFIIYKIGVLL